MGSAWAADWSLRSPVTFAWRARAPCSRFRRLWLAQCPATIQNMVAEGDYVAMWNTATATHRGELFGMPPSGKQINMRDFHFFRFANGKIVEHRNSVSIS